ncbi:MAG TPA: hypothetical protein DCQ28_04365, partial [Bacteroidetes bacterium]|nr:hypothetical protein [Bacteroidota bacterium]
MASNDNCVECGKKLGLYEFNRTEKGLICNVCNGTETPEELTSQVSNNELAESPIEYEYQFSFIWESLLILAFVALIITGYLKENSSNEFGGVLVVAIPLALLLISKIKKVTIHKDFLVVRKFCGTDVLISRDKITKVTNGFTGSMLSHSCPKRQ